MMTAWRDSFGHAPTGAWARRETVLRIHLSDSSELLLRLRWIAILRNQLNASLALSGGVHEPMDAVKAVMAGADGVQLVSALLRAGPGCLTAIRREVERWGDANGYDSIDTLRGRMSLAGRQDKDVEREQYRRSLQSWHVPSAPAVSH